MSNTVLKNRFININEDIFNTQVFKRIMGNLEIVDSKDYYSNPQLYYRDLCDTVLDARSSGFDHLTCKVNTQDRHIVNALEKCGFYLADTLVTYAFCYSKNRLPNIKSNCIIEDCLQEDLSALKRIARKSFKIDRFHSDTSLPNELCDEYYAQWVENAYNGFADRVIVARYNKETVGFTTLKINHQESCAHLNLAAVSDSYRGLGIYTEMIHEGVRWLMSQPNIEKVFTGTQINNLAVQKTWIKLGFTVYDSKYVFQMPL